MSSSLTVRQVQQYSAAFKQQLDQFQGEMNAKDQASERIETLFKQMQPQLDAVARAVDGRTQDLALVERKLISGQEAVEYLARETRDLDHQCMQASRISEALNQPSSMSRVFAVPSSLSEQFVATLERNTQQVAQSFSSFSCCVLSQY